MILSKMLVLECILLAEEHFSEFANINSPVYN